MRRWFCGIIIYYARPIVFIVVILPVAAESCHSPCTLPRVSDLRPLNSSSEVKLKFSLASRSIWNINAHGLCSSEGRDLRTKVGGMNEKILKFNWKLEKQSDDVLELLFKVKGEFNQNWLPFTFLFYVQKKCNMFQSFVTLDIAI